MKRKQERGRSLAYRYLNNTREKAHKMEAEAFFFIHANATLLQYIKKRGISNISNYRVDGP